MPGAQCEVWWAAASDQQDWHMDLLDEAERSRRSSLRRPQDQARFLIGAVLLRLVVARQLGMSAASVPLDRRCGRCGRLHGRPRVVDHDLWVSVSHSGDRVAVAATRAGPLGVDVEQMKDLDVSTLASAIVAPGEDHPVRSVPTFFRHWTRKEALLKATGDGLLVSMTDIVLTDDGIAPHLVEFAGRPGLVARLVDLSPGRGYAAALALLAADLTVSERDARPMLSGREDIDPG